MDLTNVPNELLLQHMNTLQNMVVHMVRDFPRTGNFNEDIQEMEDYIYKWEDEATQRGLEFKGIDERVREIVNE